MLVLIAGLCVGAVLYSLWHYTVEAPVSPTTSDELVTASSTPITNNESELATTSTATTVTDNDTVPVAPYKPVTTPKTFTGVIEQVDTGCFADGECFAVVGGKKVTLTIGRKQEVLGQLVGVPSIGDLESYIGATATVSAKQLPDGTYTLYGDAAYYLAVSPKAQAGCVVGGCSSQLCIEAGQDVVSTCEWTAKYSCYQTATCERQASGQCGWTETKALNQCIADADKLR
ncbi:MAG: hypothetical protein RLZZ70_328 [Candidatus Parcubacteria bacterium]|jgi:hypothetical protein